DVWALGADAARWDGSAWRSVAAPVAVPHDLWGSSATDLWAVGDSGAAHFDGATWTPSTLAVSDALEVVYGTGPREVFTVGQHVQRWDGQGWRDVTPSLFRGTTGVPVPSLAGVGGDVWLAASTG